MAYVIAVDSGHGMETAGKRTPALPEDLIINGKVVRKKGEVILEKEWNRPVADFLLEELNRCGFKTVDCSPGTADIALADRVKIACDAKADLFVSKHFNAANGNWWTPGYTVAFVCPANTATYAESMKAAQLVQTQIAAANGIKNHGTQSDKAYLGINLHVLNNAKMPALLTESGFMDVWEHAKRMLNPAAQLADAQATCRGICTYFNVKYVQPATPEQSPPPQYSNDIRRYYAVQVGSYTLLANAQAQQKRIGGYVVTKDVNLKTGEVTAFYDGIKS